MSDNENGIEINGQAAQGDVLFTPVNSIPKQYVQKKNLDQEEVIITHSETGHHHVMKADSIVMYEAANDPFIKYIEVIKPVALRHLKNFDQHQTQLYSPGIYRINRQVEETDDWKRATED